MKVSIRFKRDHQMEIEGKVRQFRGKEIVEVEEEVARYLFKEGIVLPGPEHGATVINE